MSELTLFLIKISYLAILWIFVLSAISVVRSDMFGARLPATAREAAAPKARRQPKQKARKGSPTHVLVVDGANKGERADLAQAPILIGRGTDAAIRLDDDYVSTRHARIAASGEPVVRRGPRLHERHLHRQRPHHPAHHAHARHAGPHRQDPPGAAQVTFRLQYAAISDVGRVRKDNQDSGYAGPWLLTVCDGVGGAARGDLASSTAIGQLRRLDVAPEDDHDEKHRLELVDGALHRASDKIGDLVDEEPSLSGTSTTATVALFDGERLAMGHVGDSRAYLYRSGQISQLTSDHTFVQSLIDDGRISEEDARTHPHRNLILKALDGVHEVDPDLFTVVAGRVRPHLPVQRRRLGLPRQPPARRHPLDRLRPTSPRSSWCARASRPAAPTTSPASSPTSSRPRRGRRRAGRTRWSWAPPPS